MAQRLARLRASQAAATAQPAAFYVEDQDADASPFGRADASPTLSFVIDEDDTLPAAPVAVIAATAEPAEADAPLPDEDLALPEDMALADAPASAEVLADLLPEDSASQDDADQDSDREDATQAMLARFAADSLGDSLGEITADTLPAASAEIALVDADSIVAAIGDILIKAEAAAEADIATETETETETHIAAPAPAPAVETELADATEDAPEAELVAAGEILEPQGAGPAQAEVAAIDEAEFVDETAAAAPIADEAQIQAEPAPVAAEKDAGEPPVGEKLQRARARVIKIRRTEPALAAEAAAPALATPEASQLSPEDEAELMAELAALEAETTPVQPVRPVRPTASGESRSTRASRRTATRETTTETAAETQTAAETTTTEAETETGTVAETAVEPLREGASEGRKLLESEQPQDVDRLIAQTITVMDDADAVRRRAAITHLKAAVAATKAERDVLAANPGLAPPSPMEPYRLDLESVVRPGTTAARPAAADRPPLLVLVSAQRIDRKRATAPAETAPETRVVMPTRPRRVPSGNAGLSAVAAEPLRAAPVLVDPEDDDDAHAASATAEAADHDENLFTEAASFADFAEQLGANSLHELLEASAVYCAQVLGCPQFSRTLVMQQLDSLPGDAPSREDSLRVFGTLLREGRITKIRRNQFAVTDRSPMLAEALRNAG